ncbi:hypothetical protein COOONC_28271 [Cooperia oncophora]
MLPIDRRTGILTSRRRAAQKSKLVADEEQRKVTRLRPEPLPQVVPNGYIKSNGIYTWPKGRTTMTEVTTECRDPPARCRTLPPLRNGRKKKPPRLHPISPARNNDTAGAYV